MDSIDQARSGNLKVESGIGPQKPLHLFLTKGKIIQLTFFVDLC